MPVALELDDTVNAVTAIGPVGDHHQANWVVNSLMIERATSEDTGGQYSVWEMWITSDGNPPPHVHDNEDEAFLVLEGSVDVTVGVRRNGPSWDKARADGLKTAEPADAVKDADLVAAMAHGEAADSR